MEINWLFERFLIFHEFLTLNFSKSVHFNLWLYHIEKKKKKLWLRKLYVRAVETNLPSCVQKPKVPGVALIASTSEPGAVKTTAPAFRTLGSQNLEKLGLYSL